MDIQQLLESSDGPPQFWIRLGALLAESWGFTQLLLIQVGAGGEARLLGKSEGSRIELVPAGVRKDLSTGGAGEARRHDEQGGHWLVAPVREPSGRVIQLVAELGAAIDDEGVQRLTLTAEAAVAAFDARLRADLQSKSHDQLSKVLDVGLLVGEAPHFDEGAIRLCNEVAHQLKAMRVSVGWKHNEKIKLVATNHGGRMRNDTEMAGALARVMEEAMLEDAEVGCPALGDSGISQQHRSYSESQGNCHLLSLPLRSEKEVVGVLTIEHANEAEPVRQEQMDALRVVLDLIGSHLKELQRRSGWVGARAWRSVRRMAGSFLGYRHTGWKLAGSLLLLTFLIACVVPVTHKVKAPFILKAEASSVLTAPFPGYIDRVYRNVGDRVKEGELLAELDKRELLMQRSELIAERDRNISDARKFEAEGELSDMRLSQLAVQQADSKLKVIDYRLSRTEIRAPFDGIIVQGDLAERLSSPTQVGELLMRVVQVTDTYADLQVDERDIHFLKPGMGGEMAFASRPDERFGVKLDSFEPVAVVEETGTDFRVRVSVTDAVQDWWRPGMTGVCKVDAGRRSLAWVWLHRSWEFVRLKLWF